MLEYNGNYCFAAVFFDILRNLVGYYDDENFYFESDAAYAAVIKSCNDVGEHFPLTQKALIKALKNEGVSICSKGECTRNVRVFGTPKRVSKEAFNKSLPPDEDEVSVDEDLPFGPGKIICDEESEPEQLAFSYAADVTATAPSRRFISVPR